MPGLAAPSPSRPAALEALAWASPARIAAFKRHCLDAALSEWPLVQAVKAVTVRPGELAADATADDEAILVLVEEHARNHPQEPERRKSERLRRQGISLPQIAPEAQPNWVTVAAG